MRKWQKQAQNNAQTFKFNMRHYSDSYLSLYIRQNILTSLIVMEYRERGCTIEEVQETAIFYL